MPLERDASSTLLASDVQAADAISAFDPGGWTICGPALDAGFLCNGSCVSLQTANALDDWAYALCAWERVQYANE